MLKSSDKRQRKNESSHLEQEHICKVAESICLRYNICQVKEFFYFLRFNIYMRKLIYINGVKAIRSSV